MPRPATDDGGLTVGDLCNRFLTAKVRRLEAGAISPSTKADYRETTDRIIRAFGKGRSVDDLNGDDFAKLRRDIAKTRNPQMRAMIFLGVNCGMGPSDLGRLPIDALDLGAGWLDYPRPKTGVDRRCPLWVETVAAVRAWLLVRPTPRDNRHGGLLFLTAAGRPWTKDLSTTVDTNDPDALQKACRRANDIPLSKATRKLLDGIGIQRKGVAFYALRHVFETIGGDSRDQVAVDAIRGHADHSMASVYHERISDDRLQAVTDHVRAWLFTLVPQAV